MHNEPQTTITTFLKLESAGGILLMLAALLAMVCANTSFLQQYYNLLLSTPVEVRVSGFEIAKPLLLWINDGLMATFFLLVGLELKQELLEGQLTDRRNIVLPGIGAIGGMAFPALVYLYFNAGSGVTQGWAIPAATDIAFALGVLSLLGSRVPVSLKIFLTSLAIFDDIGAILIIALFYTAKISFVAIIVALSCVALLAMLNRFGVMSKSPYMLLGIIMWVALLKSSVHATLAGVALAMFIPLGAPANKDHSPLRTMERDLHAVVAFLILPVFAFGNAGINL
jgi:NhaA family Na+:H+ antiporter